MSINILHNTASIGKDSFGLGQVVLNLTKAQNERGYFAKIWCQDNIGDIEWAIEEVGIRRDKIRSFPYTGIKRLSFSPAEITAAKINLDGFDIIHQHSLWTACSLVSNIFRKKFQKPIIIAPHGSLQKWALKRSILKKKLALIAYENENLKNAICYQALGEAEIQDFRDFGLKNPIALIPNGVSEKLLKSKGVALRFLSKFNLPKDRKILFFLSRITPKKGLIMLIKALQYIQNDFMDWLLIIAGKDEFGHKKEIEALISKFKLHDMVRVLGPLYGQNKLDAFAASDAFVLPSFSEGSPMVIFESLASGVPVITTKSSPWESLLTFECGWWIDTSINELVQSLRSLILMSPEKLQEMGKRGKDLVRSKYLWTAQADKTIDLYEWILGKKSKPEFVICD